MMSKDLAGGIFIGGVIGMVLMAVAAVWNFEGLALMFFMICLSVIMIFDDLIDQYKEKQKYEEVELDFKTNKGKTVTIKAMRKKKK